MAMAPRATGAGLDSWKPLVCDHTLAAGLRWSLSDEHAVTPDFGSWTCDWAGLLRTTAAHPTWGGP